MASLLNPVLLLWKIVCRYLQEHPRTGQHQPLLGHSHPGPEVVPLDPAVVTHTNLSLWFPLQLLYREENHDFMDQLIQVTSRQYIIFQLHYQI